MTGSSDAGSGERNDFVTIAYNATTGAQLWLATYASWRQAGVPDQAAAYFGDIFGRYIDASVLEVTTQGGPPIEQVGAYFAGLPKDQFPNMAALSSSMFAGDDDDRFEFGLDLLMRGIAAYVTPTRSGVHQAHRM